MNPYPNIFDPGIAGYTGRVPMVRTTDYVDNPEIREPRPAGLRRVDNPEIRPYGAYGAEPTVGSTAYGIASTAATVALAYHGYKRNDSIGWAIVWGVFGGIFWPVAAPIAIAQGFGKKAAK